MPTVIVPGPYQGPTKGRGEIEVSSRTVRGCLEEVESGHRGFLELVLDGEGALHRFVKLFVNDEPLDPGALDAAVEETDRIEVLAAIAGG